MAAASGEGEETTPAALSLPFASSQVRLPSTSTIADRGVPHVGEEDAVVVSENRGITPTAVQYLQDGGVLQQRPETADTAVAIEPDPGQGIGAELDVEDVNAATITTVRGLDLNELDDTSRTEDAFKINAKSTDRICTDSLVQGSKSLGCGPATIVKARAHRIERTIEELSRQGH